jgi:CopG family transcriptional regulator/antitoxin EndoAI
MHRRVNISLPEETVRLLDRVVKPGDRSRLIAMAIKRYVRDVGRANLRRLLKEGAVRNAPRDLALAESWFGLEEEAWPGRK